MASHTTKRFQQVSLHTSDKGDNKRSEFIGLPDSIGTDVRFHIAGSETVLSRLLVKCRSGFSLRMNFGERRLNPLRD